MVFHGVGVIAPDLGENDLLGEIVPPVLQQQPHHVELLGGQAHGFLPAHQHGGGQIQGGVAVDQLIHLAALTPQQGVDAGQQLAHVEGLGEVIVGAGVEPFDPILQTGLGRQHQNRGAEPLGAHLPRHLVAVEPGHHHVQDQQIVDAKLRIVRAGLPVIDGFHLKALALQHGPKGIGQQLFIFND